MLRCQSSRKKMLRCESSTKCCAVSAREPLPDFDLYLYEFCRLPSVACPDFESIIVTRCRFATTCERADLSILLFKKQNAAL